MLYFEGRLPCAYITRYIHSVLSKMFLIRTTKSRTLRKVLLIKIHSD